MLRVESSRRDLGEKGVAAGSGDCGILGAERAPDPFLGERRGMDGVMQEPRPVIIPEMVVWIFRADAEGRLGG
jgi:hypothetical protein